MAAPSDLTAYRYCHRQGAPGLRTGWPGWTGDDLLRYDRDPERLEIMRRQGISAWWEPLLGHPAGADDFPGVGAGAPVVWRSQGQIESNVLQLLVLRVEPEAYPLPVRATYVADGFLGAVAHCTHFCCSVGYRESRHAEALGLWDTFFCVCHDGVFDPSQVHVYPLPADGAPRGVQPPPISR